MSFWDLTRPEPLRQNRWFLAGSAVGEISTTPIAYSLKECQKPSFSIKVTEHTLGNDIYRYPGIKSWKPIQIKLLSTSERNEGNHITSAEWINGFDKSLVTPSKEKIKQSLSIYQVDENGIIIEIWKLYNAMFTEVNFGNLTYESDNFVEITCTIVYDYAELSVNGDFTYDTIKVDNVYLTSSTTNGVTTTLGKYNYDEITGYSFDNKDLTRQPPFKVNGRDLVATKYIGINQDLIKDSNTEATRQTKEATYTEPPSGVNRSTYKHKKP